MSVIKSSTTVHTLTAQNTPKNLLGFQSMRDKIVYDAVVAAIKAKNASRAILKMIGRGLPEVPDTLIKPLAFACKALVHDNPIIDALIAAGADVDEISTCCSRPECLGRMTPLSAAAAGGNYALVVKLLQTGAKESAVCAMRESEHFFVEGALCWGQSNAFLFRFGKIGLKGGALHAVSLSQRALI